MRPTCLLAIWQRAKSPIKVQLVTTGQTLTMILGMFFCTVEWSIKLAKSWDTEN